MAPNGRRHHESKSASLLYRLVWVVTVSLCGLLWGCAGATRLPTRTKGPVGASIEKKEIDLSFLQVGVTHREEVASKLAAIDTSYSNPRLFWGRWSESRWGYWWIIAGGGAAEGEAKRIWHVQNILVVFDEDGTVTSKEVIKDNDALWLALHSYMLTAPPPPLDLSQPIRISIRPPNRREPKAILLSKDGMEFERRSSKRKKPNVQVSVLDVIRFRHVANWDKNPSATCHTLEFSEKTAFGRKIGFCTDAAGAGTLFQYLQQAGPPGMSWR
jgi:hypothetical protein